MAAPAERRGAPHHPRGRLAVVCVLLAALTLAALGGVVRNGFVNYDDDLYLTANPELARGPGFEGLRWAFTTTRGGNWHPLTWLSHLLDARLFGMDPAGHHAVSLGIHALNTLLLLALFAGLTGALWPSALAAALFAVHPLHVESVAWAAERKDVLSTLFALLAALAWVRGVRSRGAAGASGWSAAAAPALFALALLAKPMPLTLPLLLLLLDWWPLGRWSPAPGMPRRAAGAAAGLLPPWRLFVEKAPLFALAAASAAATLVVQAGGGAMRAAQGVAAPARAANGLVSYALYLRRTLWPSDLAVFYPYPWDGHPPLVVAAAAAALALVAAGAVRAAASRPWVPVGLLWYAVGLLPVIGIVQVGEQALADRYTYLPLAGVFVAVAWTLAGAAGRGRGAARGAVAAALAVVALAAALAARQAATWRDGVALFSRAVAVTRDNHIAHNNLGTALLKRGRVEESLAHFRETVRIAPDAAKGHLNLGRALEQLGRREEAIAAWREALRLEPADAGAMDLLGVALARTGRVEEAERLLARAAELAPGDATIRAHLAVARAQRAAGRGR